MKLTITIFEITFQISRILERYLELDIKLEEGLIIKIDGNLCVLLI